MPQRKRYTKQFKEEALRLVSQEGVSLTQVAQDLGLDASIHDGKKKGPVEEIPLPVLLPVRSQFQIYQDHTPSQ